VSGPSPNIPDFSDRGLLKVTWSRPSGTQSGTEGSCDCCALTQVAAVVTNSQRPSEKATSSPLYRRIRGRGRIIRDQRIRLSSDRIQPEAASCRELSCWMTTHEGSVLALVSP
jgi:hypothetical protein